MADTAPQLAALLEHAGWVRELARGLVRDAARADDLVQETWLVALRRPPADARDLRSWLATVLRSRWRTEGRRDSLRREREQAAARDEAQGAPRDVLARASIHRRLVELVLELEEPFRAALLLRYFDELPPRAIAERLGLPEATVRSRLRRGLERLRRRLDAASGGDRRAWLGALAPFARGEGAGTSAGGSVLGGILVQTKLKLILGALAVAAGALFLPRLFHGEVEPDRADGGDDEVAALAPRTAPPVAVETEAASAAAPGGAREALAGSAAISAGIEVEGRVLRLPYPGVADEARPDAGLELELRVAARGDWLDGVREATAVADGEGRFRLGFEDPGARPLELELTAQADDEYRELRHVAALEDGRRFELDLRRAAHGALEGTVVDSAGRALPGARVVVPRGGPGGRELSGIADGAGRFRLEPLVAFEEPRAELRGHVSFEIEDARRVPTGGWQPIRVVMAGAGRLVLRVEDDAGAPLAGVHVLANVARAEPRELGGGFALSHGPKGESRTTDAEGRAVFEEVWAQKRLTLLLVRGGVGSYARRMEGDELVLDEQADGEPIVVPANDTLALRARLEGPLVVHGRVLQEDGAPLPEPHLRLRVLPTGDEAPRRPTAHVQGDAQGRYELRLAHSFRGRALALAASDGLIDPHDLSGRASFEQAAEATLEPDVTRTGDVELDLVVRPALSITGRLVDADGSAVPGSLHAVPSGASWPFAPAAYGQESFHWTQDGAFALHGLPAGRYDLYATRPGLVPTALHRVASVPAGTHGLELVVPDERDVTIRVSARAADGELARMNVLLEVVHPRGEAPPWPDAQRSMNVRSLTGFPEGVRLNYKGNDLRRDADGMHYLGHFATRELYGHVLPRLQPGWYRVGVVGHDARGEPYHPAAVGPLRFEAGEHELAFELVRTATLRGHLRTSADPARLVARLIDADGASIPVRGADARAVHELPLTADGRFTLPGAPVGRSRLWIGTSRQLARGEPLLEQAVELAAGENEPLELSAP